MNRVDPLVTRAVIDLEVPGAHRVEPAENGVVIVFDDAVGTPASRPTPSVRADAAPRSRAPETAVEPRPEPRPGEPAPAPEPKREPRAEPQDQPQPAPVVIAVIRHLRSRAERAGAPRRSARRGAESRHGAEARRRRRTPGPEARVARGGRRAAYTGHLVTFDFYQAELRSVLRTFSEISGLNIVIDPAVPAGTVDVSLREVPWDQALEVILRSNQLGYVVEQNVVRIAPLKSLAAEEGERQKLVEAQAMSGQLKVFTKTLSYARAGDVAKLLKDTRVLSNRGQRAGRRPHQHAHHQRPARSARREPRT